MEIIAYSGPSLAVMLNDASTLVCFVLFDSLRPINNLSVIKGRVFLG